MAVKVGMVSLSPVHFARICRHIKSDGQLLCTQLWQNTQRTKYSNDATDTESDSDTERVEASRDISRLPKHLVRRLQHRQIVPDPPDEESLYIEAKDYPTARNAMHQRRKIYARYGRRSGIDPGWMWPTAQQLKEIEDYEREWEPTLQELIHNVAERREATEKERREKEALISKNMEKMPALIEKYRARIHKEEEKEVEAESKKAALKQEAYEYFGYNVDISDPRYTQMLEQKEEEAEKLRKKKKKEEKQAKMLAMLQELSSSTKKTDESTKDSAESETKKKS